MQDKGADGAVFVTLSNFSEPGRFYALGRDIRLVDGDEFLDSYMEVQDRLVWQAGRKDPLRASAIFHRRCRA